MSSFQPLASSVGRISSARHTLSQHVESSTSYGSLQTHRSSQIVDSNLSSPISHLPAINLEVVLPLAPGGNNHSMLTSSKIGNAKPKSFHVFAFLLTTLNHFKEGIKLPKWHVAMQHEYNTLVHNQTWVLVDPSSHAKVIRNIWVFKTKEKSNGTLDKHKARLVAQEFL